MKFKIIILMNLLVMAFVSSSYVNHKGSLNNKYLQINNNLALKHSIDNQIEVTSCNKCHDCNAQNTMTIDTISTSLKNLTKNLKPPLEVSKSSTIKKIENIDLDINLFPDSFKNKLRL
jgi:hypothetical protein